MSNPLPSNFIAHWGRTLQSIQEGDQQVKLSRGRLIVSEQSCQIRILNPQSKEESIFELHEITQISKQILAITAVEKNKEVTGEIQRGLEHLVVQLKTSITMHCFEGKGVFFEAVEFYKEIKVIQQEFDPSPEAQTRREVMGIAEGERINSDQITFLHQLLKGSYAPLFDLTEYGESFFDFVEGKCQIDDLIPLMSEVVHKLDTLSPRQIKKVKEILFHQRTPTTVFELLLRREEANQLYDALLKQMTDDELNGNAFMKSRMFDFAHSIQRYEYIFLKLEDLSAEDIQAADECYQNARLHICRSLAEEYGVSNPAQYQAWLSKRSGSSTTVAQGSKAFESRERWNRAEAIRTLASVQHRGTQTFFSWGIVREMHCALCTGEEGVKQPGKLRTEIARTSGGWAHLYCLIPFLKPRVQQFLTWFNSGLTQCEQGQLNPIIFGAQACQRYVSLHPQENGNGRMSRLIMDYVFERFRIPPPILGKDVLDAVFPMDVVRNDHGKYLRKIIQGIKLSQKELAGIKIQK